MVVTSFFQFLSQTSLGCLWLLFIHSFIHWKTNSSRSPAAPTIILYLKQDHLLPLSLLPALYEHSIICCLNDCSCLLSTLPDSAVLQYYHSQQCGLQNSLKYVRSHHVVLKPLQWHSHFPQLESGGLLLIITYKSLRDLSLPVGLPPPSATPSLILFQPQGFCICCSCSLDYSATIVLKFAL